MDAGIDESLLLIMLVESFDDRAKSLFGSGIFALLKTKDLTLWSVSAHALQESLLQKSLKSSN